MTVAFTSQDFQELREILDEFRAGLEQVRMLCQVPPAGAPADVRAQLAAVQERLVGLTNLVQQRALIGWETSNPAKQAARSAAPAAAPVRPTLRKPLESSDLEPGMVVPRHNVAGRLVKPDRPELSGTWRTELGRRRTDT